MRMLTETSFQIKGSSVSYDFSKPYSESGEKTESDKPKIPISKKISWNGLHPSCVSILLYLSYDHNECILWSCVKDSCLKDLGYQDQLYKVSYKTSKKLRHHQLNCDSHNLWVLYCQMCFSVRTHNGDSNWSHLYAGLTK